MSRGWGVISKALGRGARVRPSPNIWHWPDVYELENRAHDSTGEIWRVLAERCDHTGLDVVDVGCGDGFHLPRFAATARSVVGVEPYPPLLRRGRLRVAGHDHVRLLEGTAQRLPLADRSVDLVHARTAYFFGPGCEPGLAEADRVLRPGGTLVIVDLDAGVGPYGDWMRHDAPEIDPPTIESFFDAAGFDSVRVDTVWRFEDRDGLAAAMGIEFSAKVAALAVRDTAGCSLPVSYRVRTRRKPTGLLSG